MIEVQSLGLGEGTLFIFSMKMEIAAGPAPDEIIPHEQQAFLPQDSERMHNPIEEEEKIEINMSVNLNDVPLAPKNVAHSLGRENSRRIAQKQSSSLLLNQFVE